MGIPIIMLCLLFLTFFLGIPLYKALWKKYRYAVIVNIGYIILCLMLALIVMFIIVVLF